tara:strand:- start:447 stop:620 length:174 start_codon:yes stop_codon:yes gene_type:complete
MKWDESVLQCEQHMWSILLCSMSLDYIHKFSTEEVGNVYLVPEDFYLKAKHFINNKE